MPFAIIGFALGAHDTQVLPLRIFALIILCMIFARSAAMAFNRFIDRKIDEKNSRTIVREIPSSVITPKSALIFVIVNSVLFIISAWFINRICFLLSPLALFIILGYSYTKRFTFLCHLILGIGLALAPIGAYLAVTGEFDLLALLFSFAVLFWVSGFDIIYALQDEEFDRKENLKSVPVKLGKKNALMLSNIFHAITSAIILIAGNVGEFNFWYWIGAVIFTSLLIYQHILVKPDDLSKVNLAFFTTNGIASIIFAAFVVISILV